MIGAMVIAFPLRISNFFSAARSPRHSWRNVGLRADPKLQRALAGFGAGHAATSGLVVGV
jgi:hypothetical protein